MVCKLTRESDGKTIIVHENEKIILPNGVWTLDGMLPNGVSIRGK